MGTRIMDGVETKVSSDGREEGGKETETGSGWFETKDICPRLHAVELKLTPTSFPPRPLFQLSSPFVRVIACAGPCHCTALHPSSIRS